MRSILVLLTTLSLTNALPRPALNLPSSFLVLRKPTSILVEQCDLSKAVQPIAPTPLPAPSSGLVLSHVAIGRGTQNYTCADSSSATIPAANGALATLFNASCVAASYPTVLDGLPNRAFKVSLDEIPSDYTQSGHHFFVDRTTPRFDMLALGFVETKKVASSPAPKNKSGDVAWLKLEHTVADAIGGIGEVYRLNTMGGSPPATCSGMPKAFEVQYAAEYWFYSAS